MQLAVVEPANRDDELVAQAAFECTRLCKWEVMQVRRRRAAHQARLPQNATKDGMALSNSSHPNCPKGEVAPSAPSASSAAVLGTCRVGRAPARGPPSQTAPARPEGCCSEPGSGPLSRTLLTVLTIFSRDVRILITLLPARPSRLKAMSMPSVRRNVCARRKWPARARGFLGQPMLSLVLLVRSRLTRRRSAALPVQELCSLMNSRTQAAIGSASMMPSIAALRLAV